MAVPWTSPELAARYSPHVQELREFFAMHRLHYGTLEDIATLAARLEASGTFREELSSMVRVILLREGGSVPRADLLEIVIIAIAGTDIDRAPHEVQQVVIHPPLQQIFAFLSGVLLKPWNEPPGEARLQPEPILDDAAELRASPVAPGIRMPAESERRREDERREPVEEKAAQPAGNFVRPESVYSRMTTLAAGMEGVAAQSSAGSGRGMLSDSFSVARPKLAREPEPFSEPEEMMHEVPVQAELLPWSDAENYAGKIVPWPKAAGKSSDELQQETALEPFAQAVANIFFPRADSAAPPTVTEGLQPPQAASVPPPSTLDPEPPSPPAIHLPHPKAGSLWIRGSGGLPSDQIRIALISGIAASLFVGVLMYSANRHSYSMMHAAKESAAAPAAKVTPTPGLAVASAPTMATNSPEAALTPPAPSGSATASDSENAPAQRATHRSSDDDYIAPPFSTPIPPELAYHPVAARGTSQSGAVPSGAEILTSSHSTKEDKLVENVSAGALQPGILNVSASEMAGNLLSAPSPGYPMLAKVAHLQGPVVVEAVVDREGNVSRARAVSGHRMLYGAAIEEVLSRRYRPYLVHGVPVEVLTTITLNFPPSSTPSVPRPTTTYADLETR